MWPFYLVAERIFWLLDEQNRPVSDFSFKGLYFLFHTDDSVIAMIVRSYSLQRHRPWNDAQFIRLAETLGDIAQVVFASFFIPFFLGGATLFHAFYGVCISLVLWYFSFSLLRRCRG